MLAIAAKVALSFLALSTMLDGRAHSGPLAGHGGPITSIASWRFDDGSSGFATSGFDGRVMLWSAELEAVGEFLHRPYPLEKVSVPDTCSGSACNDAVVLSPSDNPYLKFEKFVGGHHLTVDSRFRAMRDHAQTVKLAEGHVIDIDARERSALVIMRNRAPLVIDFEQGLRTELPTGGLDAASGRILSAGQILVGTVDGFLTLVDPTNRTIVGREQAHASPILAIDANSTGDKAITAGADGTVIVWQIDKNGLSVVRIAAQFQFPLLAAILDEGSSRVVVGNQDGKLVAFPLTGTAAMTAPPRPATLFVDSTANVSDVGGRLFRACAACHSFAPGGGNKAGPTFQGLFGRRAGSVPDYPYSSALSNADIIWNETTLSALFEEGPEHYVPGTTMPLQRLPDAQERASLIEYLKMRDELSRREDQ